LSGSIISSDKNIAVTIHEDTISGPYGGCADLVGDQLIPVDLLGQEYIAVKGYLYGDDKVYVTAQNNNTEVLVDGILYSVLNAFETIEISLSDNSVYITTSEPSYVLHMSGFGCEVGQAILPPLDCTGSFDVSVVRSTNEFFALNILVPNGSEDDFYVEGSSISINQEDFDFVPGSNQNWKYAQLDLTSQIGVNTPIRVINSTDRFHMGLIHGGATSGCRYGYFSDYGEFDSSFSVETNICEGQTIEFQAPEFQSANYSWTGPNGFSSDQQNPIIENVNISSQGEYFLEISIDDVCTSSSSLFVEINPQPLDFELLEISICEYRFVSDLLVDFPNINIYASANDTTPLALNSRLDVGTYYISQTNEFNCSSENLVDVYLSCFPNIPNAFSPNNDSLNDYFNIQNLYDIYINHELQIFNRYGNVIFEGNNENKWYGYNEITNSKVPVGTYFYILSLNNEEKDVLSGWVYVNY
jgi:gliding motility-associated-like protein